MLSIWSR